MLKDLYDIRRLLGAGSFGVVLEAWNKKSRDIVALKISRHDQSKGFL